MQETDETKQGRGWVSIRHPRCTSGELFRPNVEKWLCNSISHDSMPLVGRGLRTRAPGCAGVHAETVVSRGCTVGTPKSFHPPSATYM